MEIYLSLIIGKLPNDLRRNLTEERNNLEWTFSQLRTAISKEIKILEAGILKTEIGGHPKIIVRPSHHSFHTIDLKNQRQSPIHLMSVL